MKRRASDHSPEAPAEVRLIKIDEVLAICGKSKSDLYASISKGTFPRPVKLSVRSSAWVKSEVIDWVEARMRERCRRC